MKIDFKEKKINHHKIGDFVSLRGYVYEIVDAKHLDYISDITDSEGWHYLLNGYSDIMIPDTNFRKVPSPYIEQINEVKLLASDKPLHFTLEEIPRNNLLIVRGRTCNWIEHKPFVTVYQL